MYFDIHKKGVRGYGEIEKTIYDFLASASAVRMRYERRTDRLGGEESK